MIGFIGHILSGKHKGNNSDSAVEVFGENLLQNVNVLLNTSNQLQSWNIFWFVCFHTINKFSKNSCSENFQNFEEKL